MKRVILSIVCAVILLATTAHAQQTGIYENDTINTSNPERTITTPHHFDVVPGTDAWGTLANAPEKRAACFVSAEEASHMTTPALIQTILDYPLIIDAYAYDDHMTGMNAVSHYFPCINELVGRSDARGLIIQLLQEDDNRDSLSSLYLETLLCYLSYCINCSENTEVPIRYTDVTIWTPNGTPFTAHGNVTYADYTPEHEPGESYQPMTYQLALSLHYAYIAAYNVTVIAGICSTYNCHAYAWYSQTSTSLCVVSPSPYINDASYVLSTCAAGRRVTYHNPNSYAHSGIVDTATSSNSTTKIVSKWGCAGLYKHYADDCPYYYSYSTLKYWKRNQ